VSGDAIPDILVGADFEDKGAAVFAGRAYVFSGADGSLLYEVLSPTPTSAGIFGFKVDVVPDTDNDGITDMIISAARSTSSAGPMDNFSTHCHRLTRTRTMLGDPPSQGLQMSMATVLATPL
jgi:hypothetical protein